MKNAIKKFIVLSLVVFALVSCKKDDEIPDGQGKVKVSLTDGPFPFNFVTHANVGVAKVEVKTANGEYVTLFTGSADYDMIGLTNGVTAEVETTNIETGTYVEARVTLNSASVHLSNDVTYDMNTEATANTYTVAIAPALVVEEGENTEVLFDLDINDSFHFSTMGGPFSGWIADIGFIHGCSFNADFRVCALNQTGEISGTVSVSGTNYEHAQVYIDIDGEHVYTHTEANGTFRFIGVHPGTYTVYASTEDGGSASVGDIHVSATETATCTVEIN